MPLQSDIQIVKHDCDPAQGPGRRWSNRRLLQPFEGSAKAGGQRNTICLIPQSAQQAVNFRRPTPGAADNLQSSLKLDAPFLKTFE